MYYCIKAPLRAKWIIADRGALIQKGATVHAFDTQKEREQWIGAKEGGFKKYSVYSSDSQVKRHLYLERKNDQL